MEGGEEVSSQFLPSIEGKKGDAKKKSFIVHCGDRKGTWKERRVGNRDIPGREREGRRGESFRHFFPRVEKPNW